MLYNQLLMTYLRNWIEVVFLKNFILINKQEFFFQETGLIIIPQKKFLVKTVVAQNIIRELKKNTFHTAIKCSMLESFILRKTYFSL